MKRKFIYFKQSPHHSLHKRANHVVRVAILAVANDKSRRSLSHRRLILMTLSRCSHGLLLRMIEDHGGLRLRISQFILQVLVILQELADCQGFVREIHTQLVSIGS